MKRLTSFVLAFVLVLTMSACGSSNSGGSDSGFGLLGNGKPSENKGVPQRQVEEDCLGSDIDDYIVTGLTHNVDSSLHRDEVVLSFYRNYNYMRTDYTCASVYQYDRSTDLWTRISSDNINRSYVLFDNLENTRWTGTTNIVGLVYYDITVDAVNVSNGWICFSYMIQFAGKEYRGSASLGYGEFVITQFENLFRLTFDPNEGFHVSRC